MYFLYYSIIDSTGHFISKLCGIMHIFLFQFQDQKKLQGQLMAEQEALFGSKPSPMKLQNGKKGPRLSTGGASTRRLSVGGTMLQTPKADPLHSIKSTPNTRQAKKSDRLHPIEQLKHTRDDACPALSAGNFRQTI